jgi:CBS domain-containing protein
VEDYMEVREFMSAAPVWCGPQDDVQTLATQMRDNNIGFVPVLSDPDERKLVGVVTDRDVSLKVVAAGYDPRFTKVEEIMSRDVLSCEKRDSVQKVFAKMQSGKVRRLPVLGKDGQLVGIISLDDIVRSGDFPAAPLVKGIRRVLEKSRRSTQKAAVGQH